MIAQLKSLPVEERIQLVMDLWDSIAQEQETVTIPQNQIEALQERLADFHASGETGTPYKTALSKIRKAL